MDAQIINRFESYTGWTWDPLETRIESNFLALDVFVQREGHCVVPKDHQEGEINLGAWVSRIRVSHRKDQLDSALIERFESYPGWTWNFK